MSSRVLKRITSCHADEGSILSGWNTPSRSRVWGRNLLRDEHNNSLRFAVGLKRSQQLPQLFVAHIGQLYFFEGRRVAG